MVDDLSLAAAVLVGLIVAAGAAVVLLGPRRGAPLLVTGVAVLATGADLAISDRALRWKVTRPSWRLGLRRTRT